MAWLRERRLRVLSTSDAGSLMAVEADPRETDSATVAAGECQVRGWCCGGRVFFPALVVPCGSSASGLEGKRPTDERCNAKLVGRRQGLTTGGGRCGRLLEISSKSLCISFWCLSATVAGGKFATTDDLGQTMVLHPGEVPCPM